MSDSSSSPWDDLFADATTDAWEPGNAYVDRWAFTVWARAEGFRRAGELLVNATKDLDHLESDRVVFPIVFLYRHAIELKLKELLTDAWSYLGDPSDVPRIHDLDELWDCAQEAAARCPVGKTEPQQSEVDTIVRQLQSVDNKAGTAFRYAFDPHGSPTLPSDLTLIDPSRVSRRLEKVLDILDGWLEGIAVAAEHRADSQAEYADHEADARPDG